MVPGMSLATQIIDGLGSLAELPGGGYTVGSLAAAVGGVVIGAVWYRTNPAPITAENRPTVTPATDPGKAFHMDDAVVAPLEIPLDVVPRDDQGRTPYDIVGPAAIRGVVDQFYSRLCSDPDLRAMFEHVDVPTLRRHQAMFIGQLWGGPVFIPLERLAGAHKRLNISPERYWRVVGHLMVTLTHNKVPDWICMFTMTRLYQARTLIIADDRLPLSDRPHPDPADK